MKRSPSLIRVIVLVIFSAGIVIYLLSLVGGFFQASVVHIVLWVISRSYTLIPVFQFEVYPRLVLMVSTIPLSFNRLSPLTLIFLAFTVSAVASTYLKKFRTALLLSTLAFITVIIQFTVLTLLVGSEPTGLTVMFL